MTTIPNKKINIIALGITLFIFLSAYLPIMMWMWDRWNARDSYYSHGILVPFVTGYLIWTIKDELKKIQIKSSPWGLTLIIIGVIIFLFSSILRIYFVSAYSMFIVLLGIVLHFYGMEIFKKISFPLAFLLFMIPLPSEAIVRISYNLKTFAAEISTILLNNMRIPAIREGSIIKMRTTQVVVDDVCSGLRSLISLTALGSICAYWMKGSLIKRVLLFLSTIPIAIITNVVRVLILSIISEIWGPEYAHGLVHDITGFAVFGLAFILLMAFKNLIE